MCLACLTGLVLLIMISRFFGNLSLYAEHNTDLPTILVHTLLTVPQMIYWVLPFSVCLGILATQAALSRHVETIAMQACSVSTFRMYLPYILTGIIATCAMGSISFYIYPQAQRKAEKIENINIRKRDIDGSFSVSGGRFKLGGDIYLVEHMNIEQGIMRNVSCYRTSSGKLTSILRAEKAVWNSRFWSVDKLDVINLGERGISVDNSMHTLPLSRGPADLVMAQANPEILPIGHLRQYLDQLEIDAIRSTSLETVYYSRISFSFSPIIMTILVLPFGMRFPRAGGIARGITVGLVLGLSYWFLHSGVTSIGASGILEPIVASWTANIAAVSLGMILLYTRRSTYG
ncbi:MAG TPA: YjgP/YjgQ family permease [Deltaproteobacteria bacterium]|nr:YjgP/YjgQ family permease [Deltaproteobacteria bacterium]